MTATVRLVIVPMKKTEIVVRVADSFILRAIGLLFTYRLSSSQGLLISPCADVHTWFMRFRIDIVFLDEAGLVLDIKTKVRPFRFVFGPKGSKSVLELAAGVAGTAGIVRGDRLYFENNRK